LDWLTEFPQIAGRDLRLMSRTIDQHYRAFSRAYGDTIEAMFRPLLDFLLWFERLLLGTPWFIVLGVIVLVVWLASRSPKITIGTAIALTLIGVFGMWEDTMRTLSIIIVCTLMSIVVGLPIGILMSRSNRVQAVINPILDVMQTMPSFVYLIPIVMLLGIG
jgi:glycine betaine/proline transport system permease protein